MNIADKQYEQHPGPLVAGDLIVIEVAGKLVMRCPQGDRPQCFVVTRDQVGAEQVPLQMVGDLCSLLAVRKYVCSSWAW